MNRALTCSGLAVLLMVTACGGGGSASTGGGSTLGGNQQLGTTGGSSGGTSGGSTAAGPCGVASRATATYSLMTPGSSVISNQAATLHGDATAASQCLQIGSTLRAVTTDAYVNSTTFEDPIGTPVTLGAYRYDGGVVLTCDGQNEPPKHLAVLATAGGSSTLVTDTPATAVTKGTPFGDLSCPTGSGTTLLSGGLNWTFNADGTAQVTGSQNQTFTASEVGELFSGTGLDVGGGRMMQLRLYALPLNGVSKQLLVSQETDTATSSINHFVFLLP